MFRLSFVLVLLASPLVLCWSVIDSTPDKTINAGETLSLFGKAGGLSPTGHNYWKRCTWTRVADSALCMATYKCVGSLCPTGGGDWSHEWSCSTALAGAYFLGNDPDKENLVCVLQVPNVNTLSTGGWIVTLHECQLLGCHLEEPGSTTAQNVINVRVVQ